MTGRLVIQIWYLADIFPKISEVSLSLQGKKLIAFANNAKIQMNIRILENLYLPLWAQELHSKEFSDYINGYDLKTNFIMKCIILQNKSVWEILKKVWGSLHIILQLTFSLSISWIPFKVSSFVSNFFLITWCYILRMTFSYVVTHLLMAICFQLFANLNNVATLL